MSKIDWNEFAKPSADMTDVKEMAESLTDEMFRIAPAMDMVVSMILHQDRISVLSGVIILHAIAQKGLEGSNISDLDMGAPFMKALVEQVVKELKRVEGA